MVTQITPQAYANLIDPPTLIDVRSAPEYASGHVPNAINLSLLRIFLGRLPIPKRIALDYSGVFSGILASFAICQTL